MLARLLSPVGLTLAAVALAVSCSDEPTSHPDSTPEPEPATGGAATGGAAAGGAPANGGANSSGSGGRSATGGTTTGGASSSSGGRADTGGKAATTTGGKSATGGAAPAETEGGAASEAGGSTSDYDVPRGKSQGCGREADGETPGQFKLHDIDVTGVDDYWLTEREPDPGQAPYTFTHRNYGLRLPKNYDPERAYPLVFQGAGCGNTDGLSGKNGADKIVPDDAVSDAITVGLSYLYAEGAGACFGDDGENNYELPYWDAVYAELTENYCVDLEKVFIGGFSSGAWMSLTVSFARAGLVRGVGTGAGGIREKHPERSDIPFAAFLVTGANDENNPIHRTKDGTSCSGSEADGCWKDKIICGFPGAESCYDTGSAHARDEILRRNGCTGSDTEQYGEWTDCKRYTGCPAAFPVVYCTPPVEHDAGGDRHVPGIWNFWKTLPAVP